MGSLKDLSPRKFNLRTTLVVPFVLQIVAAVGLIGYLSFKNGQRAINNLANQLSDETTSKITQQVQSYLSLPEQTNQFNEVAVHQLIRRNLLGFESSLSRDQQDTLQHYILEQLYRFQGLSYITIATEKAEYAGAERYDDGSIGYDRSGKLTSYKMESWTTNSQGNLVKLLSRKPYDPRVRPWYVAAVKAGKSAWSKIYFYITATNRLTLSLNQPFYNKQGKRIGVLGSDITLSKLSVFLNGLRIGQTGQAFIIERNGLLVATSTGEEPFRLDSEKTKNPLRLNVTDSRNQLTVATAKYLSTTFGQLSKINGGHQSIFTYNGQRHFLKLLPYRDDKGLDWLIVVAIPESDFMEQIYANTRYTILLCIVALIVSIGVGILTSRWITYPILGIAKASEDMAIGNLNQQVASSQIIELETLANSFNSMAGQLKESFETLEDKVRERTTELAEANAEIASLNERLKAENLRMTAELDVLRKIQQLVLPKSEELDAIADLEIGGFMQPADEVGGDYYDVLHSDGVVTIGIGDVTGHGLESGILMVMTQTAVRTLKEIREYDPVRFLDVLNRTIYKNVKRMNSSRNLSLAILNYAKGRVSISGQHEETIVVRKDGQIERIDTIDLGFPVGLDEEIAAFISHRVVELKPGDGIVLYTDGITEARNINTELYGMERLCEVVIQNWSLPVEQIKQAVIENVRQFIGEQKVFDDITLLVLKLKP